jgi:hypothetical protein
LHKSCTKTSTNINHIHYNFFFLNPHPLYAHYVLICGLNRHHIRQKPKTNFNQSFKKMKRVIN